MCAIVTYQLARIIGPNFWIPVVSLGISFWLFRRFEPRAIRRDALIASGAHLIWFVVAGVLMYVYEIDGLSQIATDIVVLTCLLFWAVRGSGKGPIYGLVAYEVVSLFANISAASEAGLSGTPLALFIHILLRIAALIFLYRAARERPAVLPVPAAG